MKVVDKNGREVRCYNNGMEYDPLRKALGCLIVLLVLVTVCGSFVLPVARGSGADWAQPPDTFTPSDEPSACPAILAALGPVSIILWKRKGERNGMESCTS